jgi:glycosyltransferase involved in cell wall biosynthesis
VARDWIRPSEGFVADAVGRSAATLPAVAYGVRGTAPTPKVPAYDLGRAAARSDRVLRGALAMVALRRRSDLLHAHFGYWAGHAEAVARRTGRPWGVSLHGHDLLVEGCPSAALADLVVVPSTYLADAASRAGVRDERLRVIPSGLDLTRHAFRERQAPVDRPVTVTFAGRFVEKKGVLDAARALAGVPGVRCRFVGQGPLEDALRRLLAELGLDAEVVDGSPPGAVHRALEQTDLLLTASRVAADGDAETLGLVNLEALACGAPVVTTASGGIPEAVPADVAVLVPEGDVRALRDAVTALVARPDRWPALGRAGRAHVEARFDVRHRVAELEAQWVALAAGRPLPTLRP